MGDEMNALVGANLRRRREAANVAQADLARALGLSRSSVSNIESGRQPMSIQHLYTAAEVLGMRPADLLPDPPDRTRRGGRQSDEAERLMKLLMNGLHP